MRRQVLARLLVTLATFLVAWLVTSAAKATEKAPVCDPRGAITFAPPPQIQDLEQSIDVVTSDDDCGTSPLDARTAAPDRAPVDGFAAQESVTAASTPAILTPGEAERIGAPRTGRAPPPPGFISSLERPPRA